MSLVDFADVDAVDLDKAALNLIQSLKQFGQRRLSPNLNARRCRGFGRI